jgi:hypothetical protein
MTVTNTTTTNTTKETRKKKSRNRSKNRSSGRRRVRARHGTRIIQKRNMKTRGYLTGTKELIGRW